MGRKNDEKNMYKLWWEYLKRSEIYSEICDMRSKHIEYKKASEFSTMWEQYKFGYEAHCLVKGKNPEKRSDEEWEMIIENIKIFGDVINREFDEWWDAKYNRIRIMSSKKPAVVDMRDPMFYMEVFGTESLCTNLPFPDKKKPPSHKELLNKIASAKSYVFLAIPIVGDKSMEEISSEIAKVRNKYKKDKLVREADAKFRLLCLPTTRIRYDELKTYLKVYDLRKKGLEMTEIIKEISPGKDPRDVANQREFYRFQKKAGVIIKNVEKGFFPGNY